MERFTRFPAALEQASADDPQTTFLRLACLSYENDQPAQWAEARRLLAEHPEMTQTDVYVAAAAADATALGVILAADPSLARKEGGVYQWEPLLYLASARHDPAVAEGAVLGAAQLLLDSGADPNAGYLWHGLPTPFTVLTGVFGEGEAGPVRDPPHPHSLALARLFLGAGADPNDGQTLYNRMFEPANDHLELLLEFGLGTGDGGPWRARMGDTIPSPNQLVREQLHWAITHGMTERVHLLVEHGVDLASPFDDGTPPAACAATAGHGHLVSYLVDHGAAVPELDPVDAFVAAALAGDRDRITRLRADHPGLADAARSAHPGLTVWAAAQGRLGAIQVLVESGFDINAKGRHDTQRNDTWETALHVAAGEGDLDLAQALLALGADPDSLDERFHSTPLGWAQHFERQRLVELLEPVTGQQLS